MLPLRSVSIAIRCLLLGTTLATASGAALAQQAAAEGTLTWSFTRAGSPGVIESFMWNDVFYGPIRYGGFDALSFERTFENGGSDFFPLTSELTFSATLTSGSGGGLAVAQARAAAYFTAPRGNYLEWREWRVDVASQQVLIDVRTQEYPFGNGGPFLDTAIFTLSNPRSTGAGSTLFNLSLTQAGADSLNFLRILPLAAGQSFGTITVSQVPEPSTWLMFFAGLALIQCCRRQRHPSTTQPSTAISQALGSGTAEIDRM